MSTPTEVEALRVALIAAVVDQANAESQWRSKGADYVEAYGTGQTARVAAEDAYQNALDAFHENMRINRPTEAELQGLKDAWHEARDAVTVEMRAVVEAEAAAFRYYITAIDARMALREYTT
jgi:nitroimidazol reductase NimA-like FMN-containing flavoprotein (pyridoxamine 5'-phosphate oxidase superfamily)